MKRLILDEAEILARPENQRLAGQIRPDDENPEQMLDVEPDHPKSN
jgi:hypothetical protein